MSSLRSLAAGAAIFAPRSRESLSEVERQPAETQSWGAISVPPLGLEAFTLELGPAGIRSIGEPVRFVVQ